MICVSLWACLCALRMCRKLRGLKRVLDLLELELQVVVCTLVNADNKTQFLWKSAKYKVYFKYSPFKNVSFPLKVKEGNKKFLFHILDQSSLLLVT